MRTDKGNMMRPSLRQMVFLTLGLALTALALTAPALASDSTHDPSTMHSVAPVAPHHATTTPRLATTSPHHATTSPHPATTTASTQATSEPSEAEVPSTPNDAIAARLTAEATRLLRSQTPTPAIWRYATSLLQAATRLAPDEPRFTRFLIESAVRGDDTKTAIKELNAYRRLVPDDEFAQIQLIDLYLAGMQSSDQRVAYLKAIVASESVSPGVRSVAAFRLCSVYAERMANEDSAAALEQALKLNPLNLQAERLRFQWMPPPNPADRCRMELTMLLSNPAQPQVMAELARELARQGMANRSVEWFNQAIDLHRKMGIAPPDDVLVDYAAELLISGDARAAENVAQALTTRRPDDLNAWLIRLIATKARKDKTALQTVIKQTNVALANRLAEIAKLAGDKTATTRPVDTPDKVDLPDPRALLERIGASKRPELVKEFIPVAGGVAWLRIYFENQPGSAVPWTQALASVAKGPDAEETLARLQGWEYLAAGNKDDARVKLQAVADRDAVAALGLNRIEAAAHKAHADEAAKKLLQDHPWGLTGAQLYESLLSRNLKTEPSAASSAVEKVLNDFPREFMKILDKPDKFYELRLDPVRVAVRVGEPVLVRVTVGNISNFPLTVGADGVLHPDLWLDAQLRGISPRNFPAEAYQRLGGPTVLMPGQSIFQIVRLDQSQLADMLERNPRPSYQISATVMTNPMTLNGKVGLGPCGSRSGMNGLIERHGEPIGSDAVRQKLSQAMDSGTPEQKVRAIDVLCHFAAMLSSQSANDAARQIISQSLEMVRNAMNDDDPSVRTFATYRYAMLTGDKVMAAEMLSDPFWLTRLYSISLIDEVGLSRAPLEPLAKDDPDPVVRAFAGASLQAKLKPATQPATQPASATAQE